MYPKLARERDDRGFSIGPGNGSNRCRLAPIETRRHLGKKAARIINRQQPDRLTRRMQPRAGRRKDRHGASANRLGNEVPTVRLASGKRRKKKTWADAARIARQP